LSIRPARNSQSALLRQEADTTHDLPQDELSVSNQQRQPPASADTTLDQIAMRVAHSVNTNETRDPIEESHFIPRKTDSQLLSAARTLVGADLSGPQKEKKGAFRKLFLNALRSLQLNHTAPS